MMSNPDVIPRRRILRSFKTRGLTLQAAALEGLMSVLNRESDPNQVLGAIIDGCKERSSDASSTAGAAGCSSIITMSVMAAVVADLTRNAKDVNEEAMQLLNAFDTPRLYYDAMRKQFSLQKDTQRSLLGQATDKVDMFAQRFAMVQQRILKQDVFRPKLVSSDGRQASSDGRHVTHTLTPIESLLGRAGVRFMLGMLVQVEEGHYYLEDNTAQVPLFLGEAQILTDGFLTENCIVLVEGEMLDGVLHVHRMGNPIVETRTEAISSIGLANSDIFQSMSTLAELEDIRQEELQHGPEGMLVVLSNVHLDKPFVLQKLRTLFEGFAEANPVYVLMGNFMSSSSGSTNAAKELIGYLDELTQLICDIPGLAQEGRFIFVPGPSDPGIGHILPRPPLPKYCTQSLKSKVPHATFATNPCRIRYFTKELVLYRQNVLSDLQHAALVPLRTSGDDDASYQQHLVKTILDQGHLVPYANKPIYWQFDHALRLYPLPDALLLGERTAEQFFENYAECDVVNPGSFGTDFGFVVYRPIASSSDDGSGVLSKSDVEFSQITE